MLRVHDLATFQSLIRMGRDRDLPIRIDVVDWAATSETLRKIITRDKVVVQHVSR